MSFYQKYELLALLRDDGIKTFVARENSTGRALEAHLFTSGKTVETISLLDRINRLSFEDRKFIIEHGEHEGTPYVIANLLPGRVGLKEFLQKATLLPNAPPPSPVTAMFPVAPLSPTPAAEDAFQKLFAGAQPAAQPAYSAPPPPTPQMPPPAPAPAVNYDYGATAFSVGALPSSTMRTRTPVPRKEQEFESFTTAFSTPAPITPAIVPIAPPPQPEPPRVIPTPAPVVFESGEFTKIFAAAEAPAPVPTVEPVVVAPVAAIVNPQSEMGEFTRMFQTSHPNMIPQPPAPPQRTAPVVPEPVVQAPQPVQAVVEDGEFTRMFKSAQAPPPPVLAAPPPPPPAAVPVPVMPTPPPAAEGGEFTRMFQTAPAVVPPQPLVSQPPVQPQPVVALPVAASEDVTRLFQTASTPVAPVSARPHTLAPVQPPPTFEDLFKTEPIAPPPVAPRQEPPAVQPTVQPAKLSVKDEDFMKLFQVPDRNKPITGSPSPSVQPPPVVQPPLVVQAAPTVLPPQPTAPAPGEFTQMFSNANAAKQPPPVPQSPAVPAQPEAGEFTRMFQSHSAGPSAPPPAPPPTPQGHGEFTNYFQSTQAPPQNRGPLLPVVPPPGQHGGFGMPMQAPPQPIGQAGGQDEFARLFGNANAGMPAPPSMPASPLGSPMSGATQVFTTPAQSKGMGSPSVPQGPSDYSQMFSTPQLAEPPKPPAPVQPVAPAAKKSNALLYILLGGMFLLAILLVAFFALRK